MSELILLHVDDGILREVPSDEQGAMSAPFEVATSWCATLSGEGKAFDRAFWERPRNAGPGRFYLIPDHLVAGHAVEFGLNRRPTEDAGQTGDLTAVEAFAAVRSNFASRVPTSKRRWYGAVQDVKLDERRSGRIALVPMKDSKQALKLAPAYAGRLLDKQTLTNFIWAIRAGDLETVLYLTDWLEEQDDMRGAMMRDSILSLAVDLFPEVPSKPEEKK